MSKRTANLIVISSLAEPFPGSALCAQLACVNRKIAERATTPSNAHVHAIFAEAAFLAGKAPACPRRPLLIRWTFGTVSARRKQDARGGTRTRLKKAKRRVEGPIGR